MPRKGYKFTEEHRKNISRGTKGYKKSKEHKEKISRTVAKTMNEPKFKEWHRQRTIEAMKNPEIREKISIKAREGIAKVKKLRGKMHKANYKRYGTGKGKNHNFYGKTHTEETIKKIFAGQIRKPNSFERKFISLFKKYQMPYKYVGDGSVWINRKCPDFINTNGEKIIIEVFYDYYKIRDYGSVEEFIEEREEVFGKYGYSVLFFDYKDVDFNNEMDIIEKIRNNGGNLK